MTQRTVQDVSIPRDTPSERENRRLSLRTVSLKIRILLILAVLTVPLGAVQVGLAVRA